jgi:hypothetical protein
METAQPDAIKPTKFSKLLKAVIPIAQGGLVGGFGGNWRQPGSGNAAAQNFFGQQSELALRKQQMQQQLSAQKSLESQRQATVDLDKAREQRYASMDLTDQARVGQGDWKLNTSVYPPVEENQKTGEIRPARVGRADGAATEVPPAAGGTLDWQGNPRSPLPGTPMGGGLRIPESGSEVPLTPIGMQRTEQAGQRLTDEEAHRRDPKVVAEVDTDEKGVSTTHYRDTNPESPTYMQEIQPQGRRATRSPKPKASSTPDKGKVETYAEELLNQFGNDADKAVNAVAGLQTMDPAMKEAVRNHIREIKRPGEKKDVFQKYGINPGDLTKLATPPPR